MNKTFKIETLGCKVNDYESAFYTTEMEKAGFSRSEADQPADVVIVNTCTVTNTAAAKSRRKINRIKRENPGALCVIAGCYAQMLDEDERKAFEGDILIGAAHKDTLASQVVKAMEAEGSPQGVNLVERIEDLTEFESMPIGHFEDQHRAFLKIQDGCNQYCAYCQIPLARGPERSQIPADVIKTAIQLADAGHLEIVLTGIHTGRYHFRDTNLTALLKELLENTPENVAYRISSIEITEVTDELLDLMAASPRILPHLHIPIQAGCDQTLHRMKRPYNVEQFKDRLAVIRQKLPNVSVSTDVIVGFAQESEEEFETTARTLEECGFSFLHVFPYSRRKGTAADTMGGFVLDAVAKERLDKLLVLSRKLRQKDMARFAKTQMLIEHEDSRNPGWYVGYTRQYHPVRIYKPTVSNGRIDVKLTEIGENGYIAVQEEDYATIQNV